MTLVTKTICALGLAILLAGTALAETQPNVLAAESETYCKSTAKKTPTMPDTITAKVEQACALIAAEGRAAFPKFKGKESPFIYDGTYIWIHTIDDATMLMHPIKYKMEGKKYLGYRDLKGKKLFAAMNDLCKQSGSGWVEYFWQVPGTKQIVRKVSFVKRCALPDGTGLVIGSGIYNGNPDAMAKLEIH